MVMRDIDHIKDFVKGIENKQKQREPYTLQWHEREAMIEVLENLYDWLVDEKWKENKKPN